MRTWIVSGVVAALVGIVLLLGAGKVGGPSPYIVIGITQGTVYGLVAIGLVLVYKGARVFNFAQGEFGTLAAFIVFLLIGQWNVVPYWVAVPIALALVTGLGLAMERIVIRPLMNSPRVTVLVSTIAFALLAIGI